MREKETEMLKDFLIGCTTTRSNTPPPNNRSAQFALGLYFTFYMQPLGTYFLLPHFSLQYVSVVNNANNFRMFTLTGNRLFSFNSSFKDSCGALFFDVQQ